MFKNVGPGPGTFLSSINMGYIFLGLQKVDWKTEKDLTKSLELVT